MATYRSATASDRPTFLFDGDCAFCSACARFIDRRVRTGAQVVPWQFTELGPLGVTEEQCEEAVQWIPARADGGQGPSGEGIGPDAAPRKGGHASGPAAIARLLRSARGPLGALVWRPCGAILGLRPVTALAWPPYRWVARNRHRLPGGTPACSVPQAQREAMRRADAGPPGPTT